jgi:hypothetical protein
VLSSIELVSYKLALRYINIYIICLPVTWIILGWILERWDGVMWTGSVCLRIGTGGELL